MNKYVYAKFIFMDIINSIILGIVQGITEWLPISSSGHLAIFQKLMGLEVPVSFDVMLHFGTIIAVVFYFRKELIQILANFKSKESQILIRNIILTTIVTGIFGITFKDFFESIFSDFFLLGISFLITGCWLLAADKFSSANNKTENKKENAKKNSTHNLSGRNALLIGLVQGISVAPGISRSASTMGTGMLLGMERKEAVKYSFFASIPAILGAMALEGTKVFNFSMEISAFALLSGFLASAIAGYTSIGLLFKLLEKNKFSYFGLYCILVAVIVLFFFR